MNSHPAAAGAIEGGDLTLSEGLLALIRPALDLIEPGGVLAVLSSSKQVNDDLPAWCRIERHDYLGGEAIGEGRHRHLIARGSMSAPRGDREARVSLPVRNGRLTAADVLSAVPFPERGDGASGFAPRGARVEPGGPAIPYPLADRDHIAPPEVAELYDQAVSAQWDATRDIQWAKVRPLPSALETALGQIMTFLAENELSALYLPSKFISQIHPAYAEVAMFLATQLNDEARHIDVFLKRA
ncbi:MAG TPA: hypothetical protein VG778_08195, partial [Blastocatellia bacterium]|nr:hypothetical protein [Blastocatellia bacterium]